MSEDQSTTNVEYREIPRYVGYRFGDDGSVWTRWTKVGLGQGRGSRSILGDQWKRLRENPGPNGYQQVSLKTDGPSSMSPSLIHRLILEAFVGPCPDGHQCCHRDGNQSNNRIENLRWDTPKNNQADRIRHGTKLNCERHPMAKLTRPQVDEIRRLRLEGVMGKDIAELYGISRSVISAIGCNKSWKY